MRCLIYGRTGNATLAAAAQGIETAWGKPRWLNSKYFDDTVEQDADIAITYGIRAPCDRIVRAYHSQKIPVLIVDSGYYPGNVAFQRLCVGQINWVPGRMCPPDRARACGLVHSPVKRKTDAPILVLGQMRGDPGHGMDAKAWAEETVREIRRHTDRPIKWRPHPLDAFDIGGVDITEKMGGWTDDAGREAADLLEESIAGTWAVVTHSSTGALTAMKLGVPCFCAENSIFPCYTLADLSEIERADPLPTDPQPFLNRVAYAQWTRDELAIKAPWNFIREILREEGTSAPRALEKPVHVPPKREHRGVTVITFATRGTPYEEEAEQLKASADKNGHECIVYTRENRDSWERNCAMKAEVCLSALRELRRPLLFLDADCTLRGHLNIFDDPVFDMAFEMVPPEKVLFGMAAMRYRRQTARWGGMWNSGVLYLRPTPTVLKVAEEWVQLCNADPETWDQIHLQHAWRVAGNGVGAAALPREFRAGGSHIAHDSAHHRLWPDRQRWILLGAAPYVDEWWKWHGVRRAADGWMTAAINHAWAVPGEHLDVWFRPNDYTDTSPREPWICGNTKDRSNWVIKPHWEPKIRITLLDTLYHMLNCAEKVGTKIDVDIAGSDFIYPNNGRTHFYGKGTDEPLRYGEEALVTALAGVRDTYASNGHTIRNAGGQGGSLLPFERAPDITVTHARRIQIHSADTEDPAPDLGHMKRAELLHMAKGRGVTIQRTMTKGDLIAAIAEKRDEVPA